MVSVTIEDPGKDGKAKITVENSQGVEHFGVHSSDAALARIQLIIRVMHEIIEDIRAAKEIHQATPEPPAPSE